MPAVTPEYMRGLIQRIFTAVSLLGDGQVRSGGLDQAHSFGLLWRCRSLFEAVNLLLHNNLADEALILARSMFEISIELGEMRQLGNRRVELALWRFDDSYRQQDRLAHLAAAVSGKPEALQDALDEIKKLRAKLQRHMTRNRINKMRRPTSPKDMATKLGRQQLYYMYEFGHQMAHPSDLAHSFRRRKREDGVYGLFAKTDDIAVLLSVAQSAGLCLLHAALDVNAMHGLGDEKEFRSLFAELDDLQLPETSSG